MNLWNFFQEMGQLRDQMGELGREFGSRSFPRVSFLPGIASNHYPMINISSDEDVITIEALAPGVDPATLKINVDRSNVSISGEKTPCSAEEETFHRTERGCGKFTRSFDLPVEVDADKVSAEYHHGILAITLPKAEVSKPRQIDIKIS